MKINQTKNNAGKDAQNTNELPEITERGRDTIRFENGASVTFEHMPGRGVWQTYVMPLGKPWAGDIIETDTIADAREAFLAAYDSAESIDDLPFQDLHFVLRLQPRNGSNLPSEIVEVTNQTYYGIETVDGEILAIFKHERKAERYWEEQAPEDSVMFKVYLED